MKKAYILLHCAILLLGFSPVFGKLISLNEGLLTFYRVFFTTILLFFVLKIYKVNTKISIKEKLNIGKIGLLLAFSWLFFFAGIKYSNISIGVICYCTASFFTAILNPILTKSKFKFSELLLSSFIVIGVLCMFNVDASYGLGITLGLISPILYTIYSIYNKKLTTSYDSKLINYYQMLMSSVVLGSLLPIYLYYNPVKSIFPDFNNTIYLICLALFCTVLVYLFLTESLKKVSAFTANLTMNLEPVYAVIIAFVFFDEGKSMNVWFYVGIFIIVISIILQFYLMKKEN